jgi:hypothetical protein
MVDIGDGTVAIRSVSGYETACLIELERMIGPSQQQRPRPIRNGAFDWKGTSP